MFRGGGSWHDASLRPGTTCRTSGKVDRSFEAIIREGIDVGNFEGSTSRLLTLASSAL
jgi:hypothetical protein